MADITPIPPGKPNPVPNPIPPPTPVPATKRNPDPPNFDEEVANLREGRF